MLALLVMVFPSIAQGTDYSLSEVDAGKVVVMLDNADDLQKAYNLATQQLEIKDRIIAAKDEEIKAKDSEIAAKNQEVEAWKKLAEVKQKIADAELTAEKRAKWRVGIESFGAGGLFGAIGTALLIILL